MVSMIVPVFNTKIDLVSRCIKSIRDQSYKNIEIIVVFNGCDHEYVSKVKQKIGDDDRTVFYDTEKKGVSNARNIGIEIAKGEYVAFADADDVLYKDFIDEAVTLIEKYDLDIVSGGITLQYKNETRTMAIEEPDVKIFAGEEIQRHLLLPDENMISDRYVFSSPAAKLYNKRLINNIRFSDLIYHREDMVFNFEAATKTDRIGITGKIWYLYYQYNDSAVHKYDNGIINNNINIIRIIHDLIFENNPSDMLKQMYSYFFYRNLLDTAVYANSCSEWKKKIEDIYGEKEYTDFTNHMFRENGLWKLRHRIIISMFINRQLILVYFLKRIGSRRRNKADLIEVDQ